MLWKYLHKGSLVMLKDTLKHAHTFWNPWLLCGQNYLADLGECGKNLKVDTLPRLFGWSKPNDDCGFPVHRRTRLCNHEGRPCCAMVTTHLSIPYIANVEILALRKFNYAWCLNPKKSLMDFLIWTVVYGCQKLGKANQDSPFAASGELCSYKGLSFHLGKHTWGCEVSFLKRESIYDMVLTCQVPSLF